MALEQTQETRHKPEERFEFKWKLIRSLYEGGYRKEDIRQLFPKEARRQQNFIDWIMKLPEELASSLKERITEYEEEQKMALQEFVPKFVIPRIDTSLIWPTRDVSILGMTNLGIKGFFTGTSTTLRTNS